MSQQDLEDQPSGIHVKRPIVMKTLKELDRQQLEFNKKNKKRESSMSNKDLNNVYYSTSNVEDKMLDRLHEVVRNGNRIIAQWKNDQIHGFAQIFYHNGIYFKGQYQNGIKVRGHFKFKSGFQYIGNCFGNKFTGQGILIFPNGKTIQGQWNFFEIIGKGTIKYPKGEVYYGQIKEFKKHGKGHFHFSDGSMYQGEFVEGTISGKGSYSVQGNIVLQGTWFNGQLQQSQNLDNQNMPFLSTMNNTFTNKNKNSAEDLRGKINLKINAKSTKKVLQEPKDQRKVRFN